MQDRRTAFRRIVVTVAVAACVVVAGWAVSFTMSSAQPTHPELSFRAIFGSGRGLVTNELAYSHPGRPGVVSSNQWIVTSGSLFADEGTGWTGTPDGRLPDLLSTRATDSAVFRAVTRRADFQDVAVSFGLDVADLVTTSRTPPQAYDGVHVFLRYQSPQQLYVVDLYRRDGTITIKRKLPGGPSNGGSYRTLASTSFAPPLHRWVNEQVRIENTTTGVRITVSANEESILTAVDDGQDGPSITGPGRVGLRGDNCEFHFRDFVATPLDGRQ